MLQVKLQAECTRSGLISARVQPVPAVHVRLFLGTDAETNSAYLARRSDSRFGSGGE